MYDIEKIHIASDVPDAVAALAASPEAIVICGGSDVLIKIREGKLAGCSLVSIQGIEALKGVTMKPDGTLVIGPATTFAKVTQHRLIQQHVPALGEAVDQAGGPQLRNIGTIGGNVCNGVTSADSASTLLTLNAELEITGPEGMRRVLLADFYAGPGRVHLAHGELLTAIRIRKADYEGFGGCYIKYAQRNAMDIATLGCAVHVKLDESKTHVAAYRLAFGVAGPVPARCPATEQTVEGQRISAELLDAIGPSALQEVSPRTSWRATKAYRVQLIRELSKRATREAIRRAGGELV